MTLEQRTAHSPHRSITLAITGMTCGSCAQHVQLALAELDGVQQAQVDRGRGQAVVAYDSGLVSADDMVRAVEDAGYSAALRP